MLEKLKTEVCEANLALARQGLVVLTWGNVSQIDRQSGLVVIKPSGVEYGQMTARDMVVVNLEGEVVEGSLKPSSDLPTHLELYKSFQNLSAVTHTHSTYATAFAQAGAEIEFYGTTHADYFFGSVPVTPALSADQVSGDYEKNTGRVIVQTFAAQKKDPLKTPAVLVRSHGVFTFGKSAAESVQNAVVLEEVAKMAFLTKAINPLTPPANEALLQKHYLRKHGENAYYGQPKIKK